MKVAPQSLVQTNQYRKGTYKFEKILVKKKRFSDTYKHYPHEIWVILFLIIIVLVILTY